MISTLGTEVFASPSAIAMQAVQLFYPFSSLRPLQLSDLLVYHQWIALPLKMYCTSGMSGEIDLTL